MSSSYAVFQQQVQILPVESFGKPAKFRGYFCSLPKQNDKFVQADFCLINPSRSAVSSHSLSPSNSHGHSNSLSQNSNMDRLVLSWANSLAKDLPVGVIEVNVLLKQPRSSHNFIGFSYEKYLFYRGVDARGTIKSMQVVSDQEESKGTLDLDGLFIDAFRLRLSFSDYIDELLVDTLHGGVLKALITGDKSRLSGRDRLILMDSGTLHLVAISGLHVGIIMMFWLRIFPRSQLVYPVIVLVGLFYIGMVGFSESAQRAWVMTSIGIILLSGKVPVSRLNAFLLALTIVLILEPLAPLNAGFWYSFVAVGVLLLFSMRLTGALEKQRSLLFELLFLQIILSIGLLGVNSVFGASAGVSSIFANIFAVPWVTLILLPALLVSSLISLFDFDLAQSMIAMVDALTHVMMEFLASLEILYRHFNYLPDGLALLCFITVVVSLLYVYHVPKIFYLFVLVILLSITFPVKSPPKREVIVFDAGQGLAMTMIWDNQYWIYDVGNAYEGYSVVDSAIKPYLKHAGLQHADYGLIISHGDSDHAGGLWRLLNFSDPEKLWIGESHRLGLNQTHQCSKDMTLQSGKGQLKVLYPGKEFGDTHSDNSKISANNRSCVVRFELDGIVFLIMGDLEGDAEKQLVAKYKQKLKADVLIAGHHGSNNASRLTLLKHVRPKYVVVSSGYENRFNHPHPKMLERAQFFGGSVFNTADTGAIRFSFSEGKLETYFARQMRQAPWYFDYVAM